MRRPDLLIRTAQFIDKGFRQVKLPYESLRQRQERPLPPSRDKDRALFSPVNHLRPMVVVIDWPNDFPAISDDFRYLLGLSSKEPVHRYWYSDTGPPQSLPRRRDAVEFGREVVDGWINVQPLDLPGALGAHYSRQGSTRISGSLVPLGDLLDIASEVAPPATYGSGPTAVARIRSDITAALVAKGIGADVFVTDRDFLFGASFRYAKDVAVLRPSSALPLVGLYLRQQGEFIIDRDPDGRWTSGFDRGLFFWVAARELLPASWRWMSACIDHWQATRDEALSYLSGSLIQRVDRALRARDDLHVALSRPQNSETAEDALDALDQICLMLVGAVEVAARVAHIVLNLGSRIRDASWQRKDWRKRLQVVEPSLFALVDQGSEGQNLLTVLTSLRNTIHGEALHPLGVSRGRKLEETLVGLPREERDRLLSAIDALGGSAVWGIQELLPNRLHAHPGILVEQLLPRTVALLDRLLVATPVERLAGVNLKPENLVPPDDDTFGPQVRQHIRWQLGL